MGWGVFGLLKEKPDGFGYGQGVLVLAARGGYFKEKTRSGG